MILSGSASQTLSMALADALDAAVVPLAYERFPDGEVLVSVDRDQRLPAGAAVEDGAFRIDGGAVVVASTPTARAHIELLQLQDIARRAGADPVVTAIPYLGYARQEVAHEPGQPVSARAVARAIGAETDRVVTVDPHDPVVAEYFPAPCSVVSATPALAAGLDLSSSDPLFLAPDEGARPLATSVRDAAGMGSVDHFEKRRHDGRTVEITPSETDAADREVVIVDDIVATGSTIAAAAEVLVDAGAARVHVACVHPLLVDGAYTRLRRAGVDDVVGTDTVERTVSRVSAADAIADDLR